MRARMTLAYSSQECELREVVLKSKPQAMLDVSAKGTVPVLQLDDRVIDESLDVMRWALSQSDPQHWSEDELEHELVINNDGPFKNALDHYKYFDRFPEQSQMAYFEQANVTLERLEHHMIINQQQQVFLLHPKQSAIDVAIFPFIRQLAFVDKPFFDQLKLPKLQSWLQWHLESELFLSSMKKYHKWTADQTEPVLFPA